MGDTVPLLKKCYLQVSESKKRPWSHSDALFERVPNIFDWFQVRRARWPFHKLYRFSFKHVLHKTSCMGSDIIMLENIVISYGCSTRYDIRSDYLVCIPAGSQSTIPNNMQVRKLTLADFTPYHSTRLGYCDHSRKNVGLFRVFLSLHIKKRRVSHSRLNQDSSVNSTWLQSCCSQSRCSAAHLLQDALWRKVSGIQKVLCLHA